MVAGFLLPLGVYAVEQLLRLPDATATIALGSTAGAWGLVAVALFADGRWGQGWNGIGPVEYHTVLGQGVTGFIPAAGFLGDGRGQIVAQLAGLGAIALFGWLVSWLISVLLNLPYRRRTIAAEKAQESPSTQFLNLDLLRRNQPELESEES
jgi:Amt family ammonium transporter